MIKWIKQAKHHLDDETGWTYSYHLIHSIKNSWLLVKIAFKSLAHGLFPWVWKADSPIAVIKLYHQIMKIEHIKKMDKLNDMPKKDRYK
jgi:hypothetical protein